ncbi:MAG TPA: DUF2905 domain-containing protein [Actinomycetota bacterium]|jgi:uncharacterized protein HemY|nr:DUF2905 domain-containing protein [Actinomycetota bacterium]
MDAKSAGLLILGLGVAAVVVGALVYGGLFNWFGRLPGDIRIESEKVRVFIPITSMIILSVIGTVVLSLLRRFF